MKSVYSAPDLFSVEYYKSILDEEGIETYIRNTYLAGAAGELPPTEVWPRLCVVDENDYQRAKVIVNHALDQQQRESQCNPWVCPQCNTHLEASFNVCWHCGTLRED